MAEPIISLIIPVYNEGGFLDRCLVSVAKNYEIAQKFGHNVEVILIDDGSTDSSPRTCDEYAIHYGWTVHHNSTTVGVSEARNYGLLLAKGKYVAFLDSDDVMANEALCIMARATKKGQNIVQFGQWRTRKFDQFDFRLQLPYIMPEKFYGYGEIPRYWVVVWNKIYKRSFIEKHGVRFKPGMQFGEDTLFNMTCILANNGLYHDARATVVHCLDNMASLCRGWLELSQMEKLDDEMLALAEWVKDEDASQWVQRAINEHRHSRLYRRLGFRRGSKGKYDIVYLVKEAPVDEELVYSLRSVDENWQYRDVWFYGGCPDNLTPDRWRHLAQTGLDKWDKVRNMIQVICTDRHISDNFWLFNDDFFILKRVDENIPPQYNGDLMEYIERIEKKQGHADEYTDRLRECYEALKTAGKTTYNYEVHKPMLINRQKMLEVMEKFPKVPGLRSLYGNYWGIGGVDRHDMKIKILNYKNMDLVKNFWEFVSTDDASFRDGEVGRFIRERFDKKSRFER